MPHARRELFGALLEGVLDIGVREPAALDERDLPSGLFRGGFSATYIG